MTRRRPYHPDDCPDAYLEPAGVTRALEAFWDQASAARDADALALIAQHEALHRDVCLKRIDDATAAARVDALANGYRKRHGDWVHNASKIYWAFYRRLAELGVEPTRVK